ncbi:MAG: transcriptional regulator [Pseudonocardiales bacterium]|nr:MAG: transcriptional regulator [Pseudonocardiales bacterium]
MADGARSAAYGPKYPARRLLELVGDKWTPIVLYSLSDSVKRFSEIQRDIPDISKKMLIQVLRTLESGGLIERTVYPVVPPKTEYRLTPDGQTLHGPVATLCNWASCNEDFLDEIHRRHQAAIGGQP